MTDARKFLQQNKCGLASCPNDASENTKGIAYFTNFEVEIMGQSVSLLIGWWQMDSLIKEIDLYRSRWIALRLEDYDFVLLLPSDDVQLNDQIKAAFERKLKGRRGAVVEGEVARELLKLYELYEFSGKVIIGSFDQPYGRKLRNLLDCGIADAETLINDVILGAL